MKIRRTKKGTYKRADTETEWWEWALIYVGAASLAFIITLRLCGCNI